MFTRDDSADTRRERDPQASPGIAPVRRRSPLGLRGVDVLSGLVLVCLGGFVLPQSLQLSFSTQGVPGPGFFPALLAVVLMVLGAVLALRRWWGAEVSQQEFRLPSRQQTGRSLSLWLVVMVAALLVGPLGFPLAMLLLVAVILFGIERRRGIGAIATTLLIPLLAWLLFGLLLQVPLPMGPFGP